MQEIQSVKVEIERMRQERDLSDLRSDVKKWGLEITPEQETQVLREVATNPAIRDVKAAYKSLFFEDAIAKAAELRGQNVANSMAEKQGMYKAPAKGKTAATKKFDPRTATHEQIYERGVEMLEGLEDF